MKAHSVAINDFLMLCSFLALLHALKKGNCLHLNGKLGAWPGDDDFSTRAWTHMTTPAPVIPRSPSTPGPPPTQQWCFELRPSSELPVVDLSISMRSRFTHSRAFAALAVIASYRKILSLGLLVHLVGYPISIVSHPHLGRELAIWCAILAAPAVVINFFRLRYDIVKLLLGAYDSIFFMIVAVTTFSALAAILNDARAIPLFVMTSSLLPNIFIDADLRGSRLRKVIAAVEVISMVSISLETMLDIIPDANSDLLILHYRASVLPAKLIVINGLSSLIILLIRNYHHRRRTANSRRSDRMQHCITFRVKLHLRAATNDSTVSQRSIGTRRVLTFNPGALRINNPGPIQQLYYDRSYQVIDTRNTVLPVAFASVVIPPETATGKKQQERWIVGFHMLASAAFFSSLLAVPIDMLIFSKFYDGRVPIAQCMALCMTMIHLMSVLALSQRDLLFVVMKSFNFLYLSAHIIFLGLCMCDFFRWDSRCMLVAILCAWLEASMCIDALTPPVRDQLQLNIRGTAFLLGLGSVVSCGVVAYVLVFSSDRNERVHDRVIWQARVFGKAEMQVSLLPAFYSVFATALLLMLRIVFRAATYSNRDLVIIDGAVVFFNSLQSDNEVRMVNTPNQQSWWRLSQVRVGPGQ